MDRYEIIAEDRAAAPPATGPALPDCTTKGRAGGLLPAAPANAARPPWMVVQSGAFALIVDLG